MKYTFTSSFTRLAWIVLGCVALLTIGGRVTLLKGAALSCPVRPFCVPANLSDWLRLVHLTLAGISGILIIWLFLRAWREQRDDLILLPLATVAAVLYFGQVFVGAMQVV